MMRRAATCEDTQEGGPGPLVRMHSSTPSLVHDPDPVTTPPDWSYQHMIGGYRVVVLMSRANSLWIETLDRVPVVGKSISWVAVGAR